MLRFLPLLLLLLTTTLKAQYTVVGQQAVIATSGLNLRADARADSPVINSIPFGDRVNVFDRCVYSIDTIGQLQDYYRMHDHLEDSLVYGDQPISGSWCRVAYGTDTGYVFNAYLSDPFDPETPAFDYSRDGHPPLDYVLIYPGGDCGGAIYSPTVYSFYGVYDDGNGQNSLRAIDISYLQQTDDFQALLITTDEHHGLRFIIGSKNGLIPHAFTGNYFDQPAIAHADPAAVHLHQHDHPALPEAITLDTTHRYGYPLIQQIRLSSGQSTQTLVKDGYAHECQLNGAGDIDGDGKIDYLLTLMGETESQTQLYLSTSRKEGELVAKVATAWFSCCC